MLSHLYLDLSIALPMKSINQRTTNKKIKFMLGDKVLTTRPYPSLEEIRQGDMLISWYTKTVYVVDDIVIGDDYADIKLRACRKQSSEHIGYQENFE